MLAYRGACPESETELSAALQMFEKRKHVQMQWVTWTYRALRELLLLRRATCDGNLKSKSQISNPLSPLPPAR